MSKPVDDDSPNFAGPFECRAYKRRGIECTFKGCSLAAVSKTGYCHGHRKGAAQYCQFPGCPNLQNVNCRPNTFCKMHCQQRQLKTELKFQSITRLQRDSTLRARMLPVVAGEQQNKCADPLRTCEYVEDGKATSRCPWQGRPVPTDMQQLDHIIPYSISMNDERTNLQMLCACCHAAKSSAELADIREHAAKTAYKNNETDTVAEQSCDEQVLEWLGAPTDTLTDQ